MKTSSLLSTVEKNSIINIGNGSIISIDSKMYLSRNSRISASFGGKIELGYNNYFNANTLITSRKKIKIGDNNLFGPNVVIVDHDHKFDKKNILICKQGFSVDEIIIGSDNWICANVVITAGVKIADHIIVAANSVVTKDLIKSGVYAGAPAKLIKEL